MAQVITFDPDKNNVWIEFLITICGGIALGTYDPNLLNCLTNISSRARYFGVVGFSVGLNLISIVGYLTIEILSDVMSVGNICIIIYVAIIFSLLLALYYIIKFIPDLESDKEVTKFSYLWEAIINIKSFYAPMIYHTLCHMASYFSISMFCPGIMLYSISDD